MSAMPAGDQICNHDTAAIDAAGNCECGARVHAFPTQAGLAGYLVTEFGKTERTADVIASDLPSDGSWFTTDVGRPGHHDYRVLARMGHEPVAGGSGRAYLGIKDEEG